MRATDVFEYEHRTIERVAIACGVLADMMENGTKVPAGVLLKIVEFLQVYGNRYHHEQIEWLFAILRKKGVPPGSCPIAVLDHEERKLATLIEQLAGAIDMYAKSHGAVSGMIIDTLHFMAELYPEHIWKEDYLLLPMAEKLLSESEQEVFAETLRTIEAAKGAEARETVKQLSTAIKTCPECQRQEELHTA